MKKDIFIVAIVFMAFTIISFFAMADQGIAETITKPVKQESVKEESKSLKQIIPTDKVPAPVGLFSTAVGFKDLIFLSGQGPLNPETRQWVRGTIQEEARQTLENIKNILEDVGSSMDNVLKVTVYLGDLDDFSEFNEIYAEYFPSDPPVRTCIQAGRLPFDIKVEIEVIACKNSSE